MGIWLEKGKQLIHFTEKTTVTSKAHTRLCQARGLVDILLGTKSVISRILKAAEVRSEQVSASAGYDVHNVIKVEIEIDFSQFGFPQEVVEVWAFCSQYKDSVCDVVEAAIETTVTVVDEVEAVAVEQACEGFS